MDRSDKLTRFMDCVLPWVFGVSIIGAVVGAALFPVALVVLTYFAIRALFV